MLNIFWLYIEKEIYLHKNCWRLTEVNTPTTALDKKVKVDELQSLLYWKSNSQVKRIYEQNEINHVVLQLSKTKRNSPKCVWHERNAFAFNGLVSHSRVGRSFEMVSLRIFILSTESFFFCARGKPSSMPAAPNRFGRQGIDWKRNRWIRRPVRCSLWVSRVVCLVKVFFCLACQGVLLFGGVYLFHLVYFGCSVASVYGIIISIVAFLRWASEVVAQRLWFAKFME